MKVRSLLASLVAGAALGSTLLPACGSDDGGQTAETDGEIGHAKSAVLGAPPVRADGLLAGMRAFRSGHQQAATPICANPNLSYFGGPVLQSPVIVAVFWTNSVNATLQANIGQFYSDVMQSSYWSWLHEYDSVGLTPGTNQGILPGTFGGSFTIAPLKCAPGGNNCKLSDNDLQAELTRQINLGVLPAPTLDCTGNVQTIYMIDLPPNIRLSGPMGAGTSCVANGFCAYHNTGTYGPNNVPLIYAANMDVFTGPCALGCGGNATPLDDATSLHSHELIEAVTDPDIGLDTQFNYAYPAGWGDNNNQCGEIADICADGSPGDSITVAGRTWVVQQLWSNAQQKCTSSGPTPPVCTGTTLTGCRKCSCGDNGNACTGGTPVCETSSSNVLFGACEQCTATSGTCSSGTCQQSATPSQDDICSGCMPITTCPPGDNCGTVPDGCGGVVNCGTCTPPQTCGGGTPSNPNVCGCTPKTTCPAGDNCGTVPDGCGGVVNCGSCPPGQTCGVPGNPNQCSGCVPLTTCPPPDNCGTIPDGCGGVVNCGTCMPPQTCGGGTPSNPNVCGCTPKTTCPAGDNCGTIPDGCGGVINCGTCTPPQTCGGGTPSNPNVCGCTPITACPAGFNCGTIPDGCGGVVNCGTCAAPETCGGGTPGNPNVCGCTPKATCPAGANCGTVPDGCGGIVNCGTCAPPQTCGGGTPSNPNVCGCTPITACPAGANCGTVPDGCGGVVNCGTCTPPETCGGGTPGNPNVCGCTPITACAAGEECGFDPDGCGGVIECGKCAANEGCQLHTCVIIDAGATTSSSSSSSSSGNGGTGGSSSTTTSSSSTTTSSSSGNGGSGTSSSSGNGGAGTGGGGNGGAGAHSSSGNGSWIPLYGRGCTMEAAPLPSSGQAGWLAMAAAAGLLVRRRRGR
jgi:hypothetical protein